MSTGKTSSSLNSSLDLRSSSNNSNLDNSNYDLTNSTSYPFNGLIENDMNKLINSNLSKINDDDDHHHHQEIPNLSSNPQSISKSVLSKGSNLNLSSSTSSSLLKSSINPNQNQNHLNLSNGPSEFVKKLFNMLQDPISDSIVSWGKSKRTLIVKDQNLFQKKILPKHFKHSNFASFVRQLNKYDFRKLKQSNNNNNTNNHSFNSSSSSSSSSSSTSSLGSNSNSAKANHHQASNFDNLLNLIDNPSSNLINSSPIHQQTKWQWEFYHPHFRADRMDDLEFIKRKTPTSKYKSNLKDSLNNSEKLSNSNLHQQNLDIFNNFIIFQNSTSITLKELSNQYQLLKDQLHNANLKLESQQRQINQLNNSISQHHLSPSSSSQSLHLQQQQQLFNHLHSSQQASTSSSLVPISSPLLETSNLLENHSQSDTLEIVHSPNHLINTLTPLIQDPYLPSNWSAPPRVLIVEDDQVCRTISSAILELMGCRIETAADGLKAVSRMRDKSCAPFDLVLMDIFMPNMDGLLATRLIREFDLMTPIISLSSNSQPIDVVKYIAIGMNDCLSKPLTKEVMVIMLEKHLLNPLKIISPQSTPLQLTQSGELLEWANTQSSNLPFQLDTFSSNNLQPLKHNHDQTWLNADQKEIKRRRT
ncbi:hypothetical protein O181_030639 [Austropuccinia psidii MF-1]|uniref:Transcription factor n=1 Tax=Austropuccinia psidii MF-1 TaxID=1389203 RepID=A0A9Q3CUC1_9BASI|nr:hypothetical protein [Austropuccinia psidii MF-1]